MRNLIAFPLLGLVVIFQSSIISQMRLLAGFADLPLVLLAAWALQDQVDSAWHWGVVTALLVSFISATNPVVAVLGYLFVVFFAQILQRRVWHAPLIAMFSVVFLGTLWMHSLSFVFLRLSGTTLSMGDAAGLVTLPSLLLNILLAVPIYAFMRDLAYWVYPVEE